MVQCWCEGWCWYRLGDVPGDWHRRWTTHALIPGNNQKLQEEVLLIFWLEELQFLLLDMVDLDEALKPLVCLEFWYVWRLYSPLFC